MCRNWFPAPVEPELKRFARQRRVSKNAESGAERDVRDAKLEHVRYGINGDRVPVEFASKVISLLGQVTFEPTVSSQQTSARVTLQAPSSSSG